MILTNTVESTPKTTLSKNNPLSVSTSASVRVWKFSRRRLGSGIVVGGSPIRKCPGVEAVKSDASSDNGHSGLEFNTAFI